MFKTFGHSLLVHYPAGRKTRDIDLDSTELLKTFLALDHTQAKFFESYAGTYSIRDKVIECHIGSANNSKPSRNYSLYSLLGPKEIEIEGVPVGVSVRIKKNGPNQLLSFLNPHVSGLTNLTIEIKGVDFNNYQEAVTVLEKIFDGVSFQFERANGVMFELSRVSDSLDAGKPKLSSHELGDALKRLKFPKFEYDRPPMSLFRLSKKLIDSPLLRFLSLYQVLEFYFPAYTKLEARNRLSGIIKDPTFDIDRDADFSRLFNSLSSLMRLGRAGFSEKDQLLATLTSTVDLDELASFVSIDERKKAFGKKSELSDKTIKSVQKDLLFQEVANHVYDIRCKIVHTKMEGQGHLTPNSKAVNKMLHDVSLVEFLASKVLIKASKPLSL